MLKYLAFLLLAINPINYIANINQTQLDAIKAYQDKDYDKAIVKYLYLMEELGVKNDLVYFNLAQAFYQKKFYTEANAFYQKVVQETKKDELKSITFLQLGLLAEKSKSYEQALNYFKNALKKYPLNIEARYNYELLKKRLKRLQPPQNKKNNNNEQKENQNNLKNQSANEDENGENKNAFKKGTGEKQKVKDLQADLNGDQQMKINANSQNVSKDKLKQMNMNVEKANMVLEAMKNQEVQYLQQRKKNLTQKNNTQNGTAAQLPDW